jgi:hypothetical protein
MISDHLDHFTARLFLFLHEIACMLEYRMDTPTFMHHKPLLILIAGPYRSGTQDDRARIADNLRRLESYAWPLYQAGHIPFIGEWIALPMIREAGGKEIGDAIHQKFLHPVAERLLQRCDAVLRIPGESNGADQDVQLARERGLPVYYCLEDVPNAPQSVPEVR